METSLFLAQFWGWIIVVIGLVYILKSKTLTDEIFSLVEDRGFAILSGWVALIIGLTTVVLHNIWSADWRVVITVLGWLTLAKGVIRIGFPEIYRKAISFYGKKRWFIQILLIIMIALGAYLIWASY